MGTITDETVRKIRDEVDSVAVRAIAEYERDGYTFHYLRDDVEASYTTEELDRLFRDMILEGLGVGRLEDLFNAGRFHCAVYGFERAIVFHFAREQYNGALVSVDADADIAVTSFIEGCRQAFDVAAE